jgi:hypothetical protein
MRNILVTEACGTEDNIMVFTELSQPALLAALESRQVSYTDIVEVPDADVQCYIFDPLYLAKEVENRLQDQFDQSATA